MAKTLNPVNQATKANDLAVTIASQLVKKSFCIVKALQIAYCKLL